LNKEKRYKHSNGIKSWNWQPNPSEEDKIRRDIENHTAENIFKLKNQGDIEIRRHVQYP
jgi:hypothetical protein